MNHRILVILYVFLFCSQTLWSQTTNTPVNTGVNSDASLKKILLSEEGLVLKGRQSAVKVPIKGTHIRAGQKIKIDIPFFYSSLVAPAESVVSVTMDGQPVGTWRLSQLEASMHLPLHAVAEVRDREQADAIITSRMIAGRIIVEHILPGRKMHMLEVSTRLIPTEKKCDVPMEDNLWVRLSEDGALTALIDTSESIDVAHHNIADALTNAGTYAFSSLPTCATLSVAECEQMQWRYMQVVLSLRGYEIQYRPRSEFKIKVHRGRDVERAMQEQEAYYVGAFDVDQASKILHIYARASEHIRDVVTAIFRPSVTAYCPQDGLCYIPQQPTRYSENKERALGLRLADIGHQNGWVARGFGEHELQFVWKRPTHIRLTKRPYVELGLRFPDHVQDDVESHIEVLYENQPLASWWAHDAQKDDKQTSDRLNRLHVKLPADVEGRDYFPIKILVRHQPRSGRRCEQVNGDNAWLSLDPDSGLYAEGADTMRPSLERLRLDGGQVGLRWHWSQPLSELLGHMALFAETIAEQYQAGILIVEPYRETRHLVEVRLLGLHHTIDTNHTDERMTTYHVNHIMRRLALPPLTLNHTCLMSAASDSGRMVYAFYQGDAAGCLAEMQVNSFDKQIHLYHGAWRSIIQEATQPNPAEAELAHLSTERDVNWIRSREETTIRLANMIWAVAALCIVFGVIFYLFRKPAFVKVASESLEKH